MNEPLNHFLEHARVDIMVSLLDSAPDLQNHVSQLCEGWWSAGREGREDLIPNTLLYVVARTLTEGATVRMLYNVTCNLAHSCVVS